MSFLYHGKKLELVPDAESIESVNSLAFPRASQCLICQLTGKVRTRTYMGQVLEDISATSLESAFLYCVPSKMKGPNSE